MNSKNGFSLVAIFISAGLLFIAGVAGWYILAINQDNEVTSFEQCALEADAVIQERYPEVCVYKDQSFVNPNQRVEINTTE